MNVLVTGAPDAAPRHRTLIETIGWSHDLLAPIETKLFRRLALFADGWTLDAAEAVCTLGDLGAPVVVDALDHLVDQSLVQMHETGGRARYRFLETVRQFAEAQLEASGETAEVGRRLAVHYLALAEAHGSEAEIFGPRATIARAELEVELDNLQAALHWSIQHGDAELAMRLADSLQWLWFLRGPCTQTWRSLAEVLAMPGAQEPTEFRASLLIGAGIALQFNGDVAGAQPLNEQALAIARAKHNFVLAARALQELGANAQSRGDFVRARTLSKRSLVLYRRAGSATREAKILTDLGRLAWWLGGLDTSREFAEQALAIARPLASAWFVIEPLVLLGECLSLQGKLAAARAAMEEALTLSEHISDQSHRALSLQSLGDVALRQGQRGEAQALFTGSLRLRWELGQQAFVASSLDRHAAIAALRGERERALRLTGAASGLRARLRLAVPPPVLRMRNEWLVEVRKVLSDDAITALLSAGQMMTDNEAVAYALQAPGPHDKLASWSPLTAREQEVARLVARGFTNRQIASELVVTGATAAKHVEHIRDKLGLTSRIQIAAWVLEHDTETAPRG
jgi:non-specific serine/threonine protein kinase